MTNPSVDTEPVQGRNMGYVLIGDDGLASSGSATLEQIKAQLTHGMGDVEPIQRVMLDVDHHLAAMFNDSALIQPDTYRRNPVASVVVASLGGHQQPYAGPVAVVGWNPHND